MKFLRVMLQNSETFEKPKLKYEIMENKTSYNIFEEMFLIKYLVESRNR